MQLNVPRRMQASVECAHVSAVKRKTRPGECSQAWSVDVTEESQGGVSVLTAIVAQSGQRIVIKEAIGVLPMYGHRCNIDDDIDEITANLIYHSLSADQCYDLHPLLFLNFHFPTG